VIEKSIFEKKQTRRDFIKTAGTAAAGLAADRLARPALGTQAEEEKAAAQISRKQARNLIIIIADTTRADHLGCYGSTRVKTPNLDQLAAEGVVFTNCYADGLPTIPMRRVLMTGKTILPVRKGDSAWRPLSGEDVTMAQVLSGKGFITGFIADTYHYFKPNMNFHRGFRSWRWIRGQETDMYESGPREKFDPKKHMPVHLWNEDYDNRMRQYMMNTQDRRSEEDYFCAQSFRAGMDWLERNKDGKPFMLLIDTFDPHEPWDAPERFQDTYYDDYPCKRFLFGYGVRNKDIRPEDLPAIKGLYAAEVTFVDHWVGRFLEKVRGLGLMDDTIIVFSTDHGTHLGEEGCVQKTAGLLNCCVAQIPLIVRHPDAQFAGKRIDALVSHQDYMPTLLNMLGVEGPEEMTGDDFWQLATGEAESIHDRVFTGYDNFAAVHDHEWHYFQNIKGKNPGKGPALYELKSDPGMIRNVTEEYPDVAAEMRRHIEKRFEILNYH
jgi:arylsulfatase A-like enzyme